MVKGEDSIRRKKNKVTRKKLKRKESVSARVAAIIATKKRRKSGKRRISEGMCFSLPTADDPFRDRYRGKNDSEFDDAVTVKAKSRLKKILKEEDDYNDDGKMNLREQKKSKKKKSSEKSIGEADNSTDKKRLTDEERKKRGGNEEFIKANGHLQKKDKVGSIRPSKVLLLCLNTIQNALQNDYASDGEGDRPFFTSSWGIEYLKNYSSGNDMLVIGGSPPSVEQIAWIVSTAADTIQSMENEGLSTPAPFMLYIVPSHARAVEVRAVCKPLKAVGLHTVSVHSGVSAEHQIHGLRSCEPEFIVSTPERLLELVSSKALNISTVTLMVVDKFEPETREPHLEAIKSIKACIAGDPVTVVYANDGSIASDVQSLLRKSFLTLSLGGHVPVRKTHIDGDNKKLMKRSSKKGKDYEDKESCHCCH